MKIGDKKFKRWIREGFVFLIEIERVQVPDNGNYYSNYYRCSIKLTDNKLAYQESEIVEGTKLECQISVFYNHARYFIDSNTQKSREFKYMYVKGFNDFDESKLVNPTK